MQDFPRVAHFFSLHLMLLIHNLSQLVERLERVGVTEENSGTMGIKKVIWNSSGTNARNL